VCWRVGVLVSWFRKKIIFHIGSEKNVGIEVRGLKCEKDVEKDFIFSEKPNKKSPTGTSPQKGKIRCGIALFFLCGIGFFYEPWFIGVLVW
jgi:hypothetical protein